MLQREVPSGPRANKKLPAAVSRHLLNDVAGIFVTQGCGKIPEKLHHICI